jgi:hypothetical protein
MGWGGDVMIKLNSGEKGTLHLLDSLMFHRTI